MTTTPPAPRAAPAVRVLLVDPHPVTRAGLAAVLARAPDVLVVGEADGAAGALSRAADVVPDLVVAEIPGPGELGAADELCATWPVLVLAGTECPESLNRPLDAGARGVVLKRSPVERLLEAVRVVCAGGSYLDPGAAGVARGTVALSGFERAVLEGLARGYSNKQLATRLKVSVKTLEKYKAGALTKLGVRTRVDLVGYAIRRGWLLSLSPLG